MKKLDGHDKDGTKENIPDGRDDNETLPTKAQLPAVVPNRLPAVSKLEPPEKGTRASEANRNLIDAGISAIPAVGGALAGLGRHAVPSERDKKTEKWRSDITETVNRTSDELREQKQATEVVQFEQDEMRGAINATAEKVEQLS
ncbi:MAG: hypothetical protein ACI9IV_001831 [Paracoccaceae bacterium]|jgi:hypothetical protein